MCCFSRPVRFVGGTRIFARGLPDGRQWLAYAMNVEIDESLAMVLPLPVPPGPADDAVSFLDLSGYATFFTDLSAAFPPLYAVQAKGARFAPAPAARSTLVVHDVGMFEASFVPTRADFARLDARFRLPEATFRTLPQYDDHGFAVFRLRPNKGLLGRVKRQSVHPMAFSFPRRAPRDLFFPTVHVHDGTVPARAAFDHALYCQVDGVLASSLAWTRSHAPLGAHVDRARAKGLVDGDAHGFVMPLSGTLTNEDVWLREPPGVSASELSGVGECHAFEVRATHAQRLPFEETPDARLRAWHDTASRRLGDLARGIAVGLAALVDARRDAWKLAPLTASLPAHFMNGDQLWRGETYMDGSPQLVPGPGRVQFTPFTERVEPQSFTLGFSELPDARRVSVIQSELKNLLDRAIR